MPYKLPRKQNRRRVNIRLWNRCNTINDWTVRHHYANVMDRKFITRPSRVKLGIIRLFMQLMFLPLAEWKLVCSISYRRLQARVSFSALHLRSQENTAHDDNFLFLSTADKILYMHKNEILKAARDWLFDSKFFMLFNASEISPYIVITDF